MSVPKGGVSLTFAGAADTVTGSRYLVRQGRARVLIDCGLFQGYKPLRLRNRAPFPVPPASLAAVILTHAHLDHSGYLPLLVRDGYAGPVFATHATRDLAAVLLPDSGHLQEEEARHANRHGTSRHHPALPLYTEADARASLDSLRGMPLETAWQAAVGMRARFREAGHLLGAASVELDTRAGRIVFSGDIGRANDAILLPPAAIHAADYIVVESTYGNRRHEDEDSEARLGAIIRDTAGRGGIVLVPSFAVGRAQAIMLAIHRLKSRREIPDLPVFLNSPMAADATAIYRRHRALHRLSEAECRAMCGAARIVNSVEESVALNNLRAPAVIIAASGMATGGRILHHLMAYAPDPRHAIVFTGHQAGGTRGATLVAGEDTVRIFGTPVPVRATVHQLNGFSAHADADGIMAWLRHFTAAPKRVFVTHGEPDAADAMRKRIEAELRWEAHVPEHLETVELPPTRAAAAG